MENVFMKKCGTEYFSTARLIAIVAVLLFAPLTVSAARSDTHAPVHSEHGAGGDYRADKLLNTVEHHGSPIEAPLHCHLQSPHLQAIGLAPTVVDGDLPLLMSGYILAPARQAGARLPVIASRIPIAGPPRFILLGNFRS